MNIVDKGFPKIVNYMERCVVALLDLFDFKDKF